MSIYPPLSIAPPIPLPERPRERCLEKGASTLSLRECVAVLLGSGPPGAGALGLARRILQRPGDGLSALDEERAFFNALESSGSAPLDGIDGLGPAGKARLLSAFEIGRRYARHRQTAPTPQLPTSLTEIARRALQQIPHSERIEAREWLGFVPHYRNGEIGGLCIVERGVRTHVNVDPAELFARLLALRPKGFVLAHNHPSGNLQPSPEDFQLTRVVGDLAQRLGMRLQGHWVVGPRGERWIEN